MWIGSTVYFLSDRDGEFNLYSVERGGKDVERLTEHTSFPIEDASAGDGRIVYEQSGYLHVFNPKSPSKTPERIRVGVAADLNETRTRTVTGAKYARDAAISPTGKRAALEFRGEIVTVPAKKGDIHNLTETPGVHERSPVWSPDGKILAYFSDLGGEYTLHSAPQDASAQAKSHARRKAPDSMEGRGGRQTPRKSPTSTTHARFTGSTSPQGRSRRLPRRPFTAPSTQ